MVIVMTYWNRWNQLLKTLRSFENSKSKDFDVVIVNNNSNQEIVLPQLTFNVHIINLPAGWHYLAAHNIGFCYAVKLKPEIIIMQHSECYHVGDIISYAKKVTDETYISFACYSLGEGEEPETVVIKNKCMTYNGESAWYNHPIYRPFYYQFCSAITTKNLIRLNGFDERFCNGVWFDDNFFLELIKNIGLKKELPEKPFVFHQWHPDNTSAQLEKIHINQDLFFSLINKNVTRAIHLYSPDL